MSFTLECFIRVSAPDKNTSFTILNLIIPANAINVIYAKLKICFIIEKIFICFLLVDVKSLVGTIYFDQKLNFVKYGIYIYVILHLHRRYVSKHLVKNMTEIKKVIGKDVT